MDGRESIVRYKSFLVSLLSLTLYRFQRDWGEHCLGTFIPLRLLEGLRIGHKLH